MLWSVAGVGCTYLRHSLRQFYDTDHCWGLPLSTLLSVNSSVSVYHSNEMKILNLWSVIKVWLFIYINTKSNKLPVEKITRHLYSTQHTLWFLQLFQGLDAMCDSNSLVWLFGHYCLVVELNFRVDGDLWNATTLQ